MAEATPERDERIDGYRAELTRNLVRAHDLRLSEPDIAIQLLRVAAEGLCYCVLLKKNRLALGAREDLATLVGRTAGLVRDDEETLQALREWGNRCSHAQGRPSRASAEEATALFLMTARPTRWLHREVLNTPMPQPLEARYQGLVTPSFGTSTRPLRASRYMMIGAGILALALLAVLSYGMSIAGAVDTKMSKSPAPAPDPSGYSAAQIRKLEAALDARDAERVASLYAEPTTLFGRRFESRSELARWTREWWNGHPDEKATFSTCRKVGSTPRGDVFACDGTVTRSRSTVKFTECVRWSPENLIELRDTAPAPGAPSAGCPVR